MAIRKNSKQKNKKDLDKEFDDILSQNHKKPGQSILNSINFLSNISPKNEKQKQLLKKIHDNKIIFISGSAGTGKTFITIKGVLEVLKKENSNIEHIIITKPIVEAGPSLGYLPGDVADKISVYLHSFESTFKKIIGESGHKMLMNSGIIKALPLSYMRGATFDNAIAIMDEAQNLTIGGLKLFISRIGDNTKLIIIGDSDQTDLKLKLGEKDALSDALTRFQGLKDIAFVEFNEDDIVRNDILVELMKRYKNK